MSLWKQKCLKGFTQSLTFWRKLKILGWVRGCVGKEMFYWRINIIESLEWKRVQKRFYDNIWACNITLDVILRGNGVVLCAAILSSMAQPVGIQNLLPTRHLWVSFCSCWTSITLDYFGILMLLAKWWFGVEIFVKAWHPLWWTEHYWIQERHDRAGGRYVRLKLGRLVGLNHQQDSS